MTDREKSKSPRTPANEAETVALPAGMDSAPIQVYGFEGYEILRELSRGGQGVVYLAHEKATKRKVAIKVLRDGPHASNEATKRFQREIELIARLEHADIVAVLHAGVTANGLPYFVMPYIRGRPLTEFVNAESLTLLDVCRIFARICDALHHAHGRGVIHRDLKPSNVLVEDEGQPRILDFGLAKILAGAGDSLVSVSRTAFGTLAYMAPEQVRGNPDLIDARTDVYAIGVLLYSSLTGQMPYPTNGPPVETMQHILTTEPVPPSRLRADLDRQIDTIVLKCLAKERGDRYSGADSVAEDLRSFVSGEPISARRDHFAYVVRKLARNVMSRHPIVTAVLIALATTVLGQAVLNPLVMRTTILTHLFERAVSQIADTTPPGASLRHVRILGIQDDPPTSALFKRAGLPDESMDNPRSLRRVHGVLLKRLAAASPRVVVLDIVFGARSDFDRELIDGVQTLNDAGVPVIAAVQTWWTNEQGAPELNPELAPLTRWGCIQGEFENNPWRILLIMRRGPRHPLPSLALAAVAAYAEPRGAPTYEFDDAKNTVTIGYQKPAPNDSGTTAWLPTESELILSYVHRVESGTALDACEGLEPNDLVGFRVSSMTDQSVLHRATLGYGDVLAASPHQLRDIAEGRAVIIGDLRSGVDRHRFGQPTGQPGCYAHAVMIEQLLQELAFPGRRPAPLAFSASAAVAMCAVAGVVIGFCSFWRREVLAAVSIFAICAISGLAAQQAKVLLNPIVPILTLLIACYATALLKLGPAWAASRRPV